MSNIEKPLQTDGKGALDTLNPMFLGNFIIAYTGPRILPLLASSIILCWYTTDVGRFTSTDTCYRYIANKSATFFLNMVWFLALEVFASLSRVLIERLLNSYAADYIDPFTRTFIELLMFFIPEWFYRVCVLIRLNVLTTAAVYMIEEMVFWQTTVDEISPSKDALYLGNTILLNAPTTWNMSLQNTLFCQAPTNQKFVRGNLGEFALESVAGKMSALMLAGMTFAEQSKFTVTQAAPNVGFSFGNAALGAATGLYNFVTDDLVQSVSDCFFIGSMNFVLLYSGIGPAGQVYSYAMNNAIVSAESSLVSSNVLIDPYLAAYGAAMMNDLGISSFNVFKQWLAYIANAVGATAFIPVKQLPLLKAMSGTIAIQALIMGILYQPVSFDKNSEVSKIMDEQKDALVRFEMVAALVRPSLGTYLRYEIELMIRKRFEKVFTYTRIHAQRYIFSMLGFNLAFLDHYKAFGDKYIGDDNMKELLWDNAAYAQRHAMFENIVQHAQPIAYVPATLQDIIDNTKLYSSNNPVRIYRGGIVLAEQQAM